VLFLSRDIPVAGISARFALYCFALDRECRQHATVFWAARCDFGRSTFVGAAKPAVATAV
jgi:hypothetical protein